MPGPWDSPKEVTEKTRPIELPDMVWGEKMDRD
jgi:hypothetical protein